MYLIHMHTLDVPTFATPILNAVVHPITAEAKLQLTLKAGRDPNIPQALIMVVLEEVAVAVKKQQVGPVCLLSVCVHCIYVCVCVCV